MRNLIAIWAAGRKICIMSKSYILPLKNLIRVNVQSAVTSIY